MYNSRFYFKPIVLTYIITLSRIRSIIYGPIAHNNRLAATIVRRFLRTQ